MQISEIHCKKLARTSEFEQIHVNEVSLQVLWWSVVSMWGKGGLDLSRGKKEAMRT